MGFFNRIRANPGFVSPVRSDPGFVSPIRSDPIRSDPIRSDPVRSGAIPLLSSAEFSQYRYISTVAFRSTSRSDVTIRSLSFELGFHLAKHFTPTYGVKTADNNFLRSLRSGRDNNIHRGTLPVSGVYLNNFPFIICLTPGPLYAVDMTIKAIRKANNFLLLDSVFPLAL